MGCFSVHHQRKPRARSALPSSLIIPKSLIIAELEQAFSCASPAHFHGGSFRNEHVDSHRRLSMPSPVSYDDSSRNFELVEYHVSLSKPSPLHSSSLKLTRSHLKSSSVSSSRRPPHVPLTEITSLTKNGAVERSLSYDHSDKRLAVSRSLIDIEQAIPDDTDLDTANTNLFPLPPPPTGAVRAVLPSAASTDDASSQSVSSSGSGSSLSSLAPCSSSSASARSVCFKHGKISSSCSLSTAESHPLQRVYPPALPLPPLPDVRTRIREFSYEELAGACLNFAPEFFIREGGAGPVFRAILKYGTGEEGRLEVAVTRLTRARKHSFRKWRLEVASLARLSHPHLCKVLGFSGEEPLSSPDKLLGSQRERLIVYEHTSNGSLESLLYCRKGKAPIDWVTRVKIAAGAAQGLAYLHERMPRQIIYKSFRTINVQVDVDFNSKLSDYGFARSWGELPMSSPAHLLPVEDLYMAPETRMYDELSVKSNVWSFGIVLLEILTGRQHMDDLFPQDERNLLQWCRPYLLDSKRLYLIMDPELKGRYPTRAAKLLADVALHCIAADPEARPCMRDVAISLRMLAQASKGGDVKAEDAFNIAANCRTDMMRQINPAVSFGFGYHHSSKRIGCSTPSYSRSEHSKYGSKFKLSTSYNLASLLASPGRAFGGSARAMENTGTHNQKTRLAGCLSQEISKEACRSMAREHPFLTSYGFISGESGISGGGLTSNDPPPLGRSISSPSTKAANMVHTTVN